MSTDQRDRQRCTRSYTSFEWTSLRISVSVGQAAELELKGADTPLTYEQLLAPDSTYTIVRCVSVRTGLLPI